MATNDKNVTGATDPMDLEPEIPTTGQKRASGEAYPVGNIKREKMNVDEQETSGSANKIDDNQGENKKAKKKNKSKSILQALLFSDEELDSLSSTDCSSSDSDSVDPPNEQADKPSEPDAEINTANSNISSSDPIESKENHQSSPKSASNQESKPAKTSYGPGTLSLIAEAMRSFNTTFPKFEQTINVSDKAYEVMESEESDDSDDSDDSEQSDDKVEKTKKEGTSEDSVTEETKSVQDRKRMANWNSDKDKSSSSSSADESPTLGSAEKPKTLEESDLQAQQDHKANSPASVKDSDSDDSSSRRKTKTYNLLDVNNGRDFFEDDGSFEEDKMNAREYDRINGELSAANILNDYEHVFHEVRKVIGMVPNRFKFEIYNLLYPTLVMVYLRMIDSGKFRRGKTFVETCRRFIDDSYAARVENLMTLQSPSDLPKKAKKLLANENKDQIVVSMCEETCDLMLILIKGWSNGLQCAFLRHFDLVPHKSKGIPSQHDRIGCATLEKIYWATETVKVKEASPRPLRRKRLKKSKASPTKNINVPTGNRLYTPIPKRWDLERQKDDEEHRLPLSRETLPSLYLYTTPGSVEIVICATFSHTSTMLCLGTTSGTIYIFSLTSSKLMQLKPASCLRKLDTSMSGIDESMLDKSNTKMRRMLYGHRGPVYGCSFAPNDRFVLTSSMDRTVRCWCLLTWKCVVIYPGHSSAVFCVIYAPLGYYFASGSDDRTARIWTQDNKKSICILGGHLAEVVCVKFHPNRHYLATGSADCTVRLWDIIKAIQVRVFSGHRGTISALDFSVCGRYMVTGADDCYVIAWDIDKEQLIQSLLYHTASINCIKFPYDNKIFAVAGQDCQVTIWDFERLIQEYESSEEKNLATNEVLIQAYSSKETPIYKLHFTTRNMLLGFCVELASNVSVEANKAANSKSSYENWLTFLDILKTKAQQNDVLPSEVDPSDETVDNDDQAVVEIQKEATNEEVTDCQPAEIEENSNNNEMLNKQNMQVDEPKENSDKVELLNETVEGKMDSLETSLETKIAADDNEKVAQKNDEDENNERTSENSTENSVKLQENNESDKGIVQEIGKQPESDLNLQVDSEQKANNGKNDKNKEANDQETKDSVDTDKKESAYDKLPGTKACDDVNDESESSDLFGSSTDSDADEEMIKTEIKPSETTETEEVDKEANDQEVKDGDETDNKESADDKPPGTKACDDLNDESESSDLFDSSTNSDADEEMIKTKNEPSENTKIEVVDKEANPDVEIEQKSSC